MGWTEDDLKAHYQRLSEVYVGPDKPPQAPESAPDVSNPEWWIEAECTKFMEQDGWRALRTDPVSDRSKGKGFGELGMADHLFMRPFESHLVPRIAHPICSVLWVEFKVGAKKADKHQVEWHAKERAKGFMTWIANEDFPATLDGFREKYASSGLMRRKRWW